MGTFGWSLGLDTLPNTIAFLLLRLPCHYLSSCPLTRTAFSAVLRRAALAFYRRARTLPLCVRALFCAHARALRCRCRRAVLALYATCLPSFMFIVAAPRARVSRLSLRAAYAAVTARARCRCACSDSPSDSLFPFLPSPLSG